MSAWRPLFTRDPDGVLFFGPLAILGGWLPFIGFRTVEMGADGMMVLTDPETGVKPPVVGRKTIFCIEWLGFGFSWERAPE